MPFVWSTVIDKNYNFYLKVGLTKKGTERDSPKSCPPHTSISSFFEVLVAIDSLDGQMDYAAGEEKQRLKRQIDRLEKRKKDLKYRTIEQLYNSMANLIYFFEMTQSLGYEQLDKDIQHLLGISKYLYDPVPKIDQTLIDSSSVQFFWYLRELGLRSSHEKGGPDAGYSEMEKNRSINKLDPRTRVTLQRFQSNFARLLAGMLEVDSNQYPDFRLVLAAIMQDLVTYKVLKVLPKAYEGKEHILMAAKDALDAAKNWSEDLSEGSQSELETTESKRKIERFSTMTSGAGLDSSKYL
jgi:hypothetical protein